MYIRNLLAAATSAAIVTLSAAAQIVAPAPATITKNFGNPAIASGQSTTVTFVITNPNIGNPLTGITLEYDLPPGLFISNSTVISTCTFAGPGSGVTVTPNAVEILIRGATLTPMGNSGSSCTVTVNVTGRGSGPLSNTTGPIFSIESGNGQEATAGILVGDPFQVRYAANLTTPATGGSVIDITNTGASATISDGNTINGNICVNVYAFSPDEQLIECCSCLVTPNGLASLSAKTDLISNTLTPRTPSSIVIKLLASTGTPSSSGVTCNAAAVSPFILGGDRLADGLAAWGTTLHAARPGADNPNFGITETPFCGCHFEFRRAQPDHYHVRF